MSNLAEDVKQEQPPLQAVAPSTEPQIPHFDSKYIDEIFPILESGKKKFNWLAFFFGPFWLPYKGLWKEWAMIYLSAAVFIALFEVLPIPAAAGKGIGLGIGIAAGMTANKFYYDKYKRLGKSALRKSIGAGIGGAVAYFAFAITLLLLAVMVSGKGL